MQTIQYSIPESIQFHFEIIRGFFAAIANGVGGALIDTGFIDLGGQILLLDVGSPKALADMRVACNFIARIVNRHAHSDHGYGNQVIDKSTIISYESALQSMQTQHESAMQDIYDPTEIEEILQEYQKHFTIEANPKVRQILKDSIARFACYLESISNLQPRLLIQIFSQMVIFRGSEWEAEPFKTWSVGSTQHEMIC